ncbi:hypothetical protein B0H14DRAFT_2580026 [Mycena olivaceomarginata]|nr:hypothetical protein B0H14DRAFT_2580026 [Mycena olivaceomarginata]
MATTPNLSIQKSFEIKSSTARQLCLFVAGGFKYCLGLLLSKLHLLMVGLLAIFARSTTSHLLFNCATTRAIMIRSLPTPSTVTTMLSFYRDPIPGAAKMTEISYLPRYHPPNTMSILSILINDDDPIVQYNSPGWIQAGKAPEFDATTHCPSDSGIEHQIPLAISHREC